MIVVNLTRGSVVRQVRSLATRLPRFRKRCETDPDHRNSKLRRSRLCTCDERRNWSDQRSLAPSPCSTREHPKSRSARPSSPTRVASVSSKPRGTTSSRSDILCGSFSQVPSLSPRTKCLTRPLPTPRHGMPLPDPYLKLFDARYLRPLTPIPFPTPPAFVRFHPRLSGNVVVASSEGRVQMLDLKDIGKGSVFQVRLPPFVI